MVREEGLSSGAIRNVARDDLRNKNQRIGRPTSSHKKAISALSHGHWKDFNIGMMI
jgi:hypothetical protein